MNPNPNFWLSLGGMATALAVLGAIGLWALRMVIRDELRPVATDVGELRGDVSKLKVDVGELREAVFETPRQDAGRGSHAS
jgi:hypothetical protein